MGIPGSCFAVSIGFGPAGLSGALSSGLGPTISAFSAGISRSPPFFCRAAGSFCPPSKPQFNAVSLFFSAFSMLMKSRASETHLAASPIHLMNPLILFTAHWNFPQIHSHILLKYGPTTDQFSVSQ